MSTLFDTLAANNVWQTPTLVFFRVLPDVFSGKPIPHAEYASDTQLDLLRGIIQSSKLDEQAMAFLTTV